MIKDATRQQFGEYENMLGNRRQFPSGVRAAACFDLLIGAPKALNVFTAPNCRLLYFRYILLIPVQSVKHGL